MQGCPYRHAGDQQLSALVGSLRLGAADSAEILRLSREQHYQLACARHFEATHPGHQSLALAATEGVSSHPNRWYLASRAYERAKSGATAESSSGEDSQPDSTQEGVAPDTQYTAAPDSQQNDDEAGETSMN